MMSDGVMWHQVSADVTEWQLVLAIEGKA